MDGIAPESAPVGDLTPEEVRVLGCLVEKEATTPDNYPLTLNSLGNACNQSTSRDPVVSFTDHDVVQALDSLRSRGLTRTVHSSSNRATKYRHVVDEALGLTPSETAVLSVLLLRGAQTVGELKGRSERQHTFASIDEVAGVLDDLAGRPVPLARRVPRQPGQKEDRWVHLLAEPADDGVVDGDDAAAPGGGHPATSSSATPSDPYGAATAEFYDLLATAHWETFGLELLELLDGVDPAVGPILDIGCGTGAGLAYLRAAVPDARIHAIEPSRAMRTALHARLALDDELRHLTTVDPRPLAEAELPATASATVVSATLGHLTDDERDLLWRYVAESMPPGAPVVIEILPPHRPITVPPTRYRELPVGDYVYEGWQEGAPLDEHHMAWTMTYRVRHGAHQIAESSVESTWRCAGADDVRSEVAPFGLLLEDHGDYVVVRRPG